MTAPHFRRVTGYPVYSYLNSSGALAASASTTYTLPSGPGEFIGFGILKYGGLDSDFQLLGIQIWVDSSLVYNNFLCVLASMNLTYSGHQMHATHDIQTADLASFSYRSRFGYETSCILVFTNTSAASLDLAIGVHSRRGA